MGAYDELRVALTGLEAQLPAFAFGHPSGLDLYDALERAAGASGQSEALNRLVQDAVERWLLEGSWRGSV